MPFEYSNDPALRPPITREISWESMVRQSWGTDYNKPEIVYRFTNGRTFNEYTPPQARTD